MRVKRYIVNKVPDALPMIRSELGKEAVILNTKEIKVGGFLGLFGKKKMEVIAAVESGGAAKEPAPERAPAPSFTPPSRKTAGWSNEQGGAAPIHARSAAATSTAYAPTAVSNTQGPTSISGAHGSIKQAVTTSRDAVATLEVPGPRAVPPAAASAYYTAAKQASVSVDPVPAEKTASEEDNFPVAGEKEEQLLSEIRDMKSWIRQLTRQYAEQALPDNLQALRERLLQQEVSADLVSRLLEELQAHHLFGEAAGSRREIWQLAGGMLTEWLEPLTAGGIAANIRTIHFVGPTGVGKTTTIAKLAAEQILKQGRKVGFVTSDTYRIAAVDQLRTYANILNVPLEVVFSPAEASRAFRQLEDRDLIFMDTAGRNYRSELHVSEVSSLLSFEQDSETLLVLSLTGKSKDMADVAQPFIRHGVRKVVFTKMDETSQYGAILNLAMEQGMMPTYIGFGQTVPDDIEPFRAASYIERLLGDAADE
ncbi:flagellar biosynthesis protein FlhF [Paenibacillus beijingensis]|uniref:Flagellar biosynthesis protein FlhF n=1 Tax=Paenibacillus beijingensis TaxID=1126833 RepID=A0A0D5NN36_9BACL|nr:flagellar biosynthesis protein FlhF [Paenibacillus beijingensis]AJY76585.1 hypothetical protein VN24_20940 [Paenibacillus beijingensis]